MKQICILILSLIFSTISELTAQTDAHYWSHQYGAKGLLLNGAVIASADDETAMYYNPACMGQDNNIGFAFSFLTPTYAYLKNNNLISDNTSLKDDDLGLSPGFAAIRFKPFKTDKIIVGIASFERLKSNIRFQDRIVDNIQNNSFLLYSGDLDFSRKLSQHWLGVGLSYKINKNMAVGISQYSIWHSESLNLSFKKEIFSQVNPQNLFLAWRSDFNYSFSAYAGFLSKLGFVYSTEAFKFGFTYTSPAYAFSNTGASYSFDDFKINVGELTNLSNKRIVDLNQFKTPPALGIGFEFKIDNLQVSISSEYFRKTENYTLFEDIDDPFDGLSAVNEPSEVRVTTANKRVFNFAIGFQRYVNEHKTWLWGFRTDFNQNSNFDFNGVSDYLSTSPDIFHISGGGRFFDKKNQWSIGLDYGFGFKSGGMQLTDLENINAENIFGLSGKNNVDTYYHSLMIFLTYDFLFGNVEEL